MAKAHDPVLSHCRRGLRHIPRVSLFTYAFYSLVALMPGLPLSARSTTRLSHFTKVWGGPAIENSRSVTMVSPGMG